MHQMETSAFAYAEVDPHELRMILRASHEAFIEFMLPDETQMNEGVEDFHLLIFGRFVDMKVPRDVAALPRDHAKTTYLRLAFTYLMWYSPVQFFVYMGPTHAAACASLQVIWNYLRDDNSIEIFGAPIPEIIRISEGYLEFDMYWYDEKGNNQRKRVILKAQGAQQQVRGMNVHGMRPQYVGCDDIEDETAVKTEEGYRKFLAWFDNTFMRAVSRQIGLNKVAQIGNLIGIRTLLNDNLNDPDWRSIRLGVVRESGRPLWAKRFSLAAIKKELEASKRRGQLSAWFGEMMNMPLNVETALIDYEKITWSNRRHPNDGHEYASFITVDPAISEKETADEAAVVLHTIDEGGVPQVSDYVHYRGMTPDKIAEEVRILSERWGCYVVGVESVQLQRILIYYLELAFATIGKTGMNFVPIEVGRSYKMGRLISFASAVTVGEYTLATGDWDLSAQMMQIDKTKTNNLDDLTDAAAMGLYMLRNHAGLIHDARARTLGAAKQKAMPNRASI